MTRSAAEDDPPRYARPFVAVFLATVVACAVLGVNAWPFSNWRLFSTMASDHQTRWEATAVDPGGREVAYPISAPPHGYGGLSVVMTGFPRRSATARDTACGVWMRGATRDFGPTIDILRIYRLDWRLSVRRGLRAAPPRRTLSWVCSRQGARAVG